MGRGLGQGWHVRTRRVFWADWSLGTKIYVYAWILLLFLLLGAFQEYNVWPF